MSLHSSHFAKLEIYTGPMRSGKSSKLLEEATKSSLANFKTLFINSAKDTRNPTAAFSSHNPVYRKKVKEEFGFEMVQTEKLMNLVSDLKNYDTICIDEGQFFPDLADFVFEALLKEKKRVIVSALDGCANQKPFGDQLIKIQPYASICVKLNGFCQRCAKKKLQVEAPFTFYNGGGKLTQILVGDSVYETLCLECLLKAKEEGK